MLKIINVSDWHVFFSGLILLTVVRQQLFREIKLWLKLEHENIVPLLGVTDGFSSLPALVSPWFQNGTLTGYLQRKHKMLSHNAKFALVRSFILLYPPR